jgi:hypothetical protein
LSRKSHRAQQTVAPLVDLVVRRPGLACLESTVSITTTFRFHVLLFNPHLLASRGFLVLAPPHHHPTYHRSFIMSSLARSRSIFKLYPSLKKSIQDVRADIFSSYPQLNGGRTGHQNNKKQLTGVYLAQYYQLDIMQVAKKVRLTQQQRDDHSCPRATDYYYYYYRRRHTDMRIWMPIQEKVIILTVWLLCCAHSFFLLRANRQSRSFSRPCPVSKRTKMSAAR